MRIEELAKQLQPYLSGAIPTYISMPGGNYATSAQLVSAVSAHATLVDGVHGLGVTGQKICNVRDYGACGGAHSTGQGCYININTDILHYDTNNGLKIGDWIGLYELNSWSYLFKAKILSIDETAKTFTVSTTASASYTDLRALEDDSVPINAAITQFYTGSNTGICAFYFPTGVYQCLDPIIMPGGAMQFYGIQRITSSISSYGCNVIEVTGPTHLIMQDLEIIPAGPSGEGAKAGIYSDIILVDGCIDRCWFEEGGGPNSSIGIKSNFSTFVIQNTVFEGLDYGIINTTADLPNGWTNGETTLPYGSHCYITYSNLLFYICTDGQHIVNTKGNTYRDESYIGVRAVNPMREGEIVPASSYIGLKITAGNSRLPILDSDDITAIQITSGLSKPVNALENPGFETAGTGTPDVFSDWVEDIIGTATIVLESSLVHSGTCAARLHVSDADSYAILMQNVSVTAGDDWELSFWTRGDASGNDSVFAIYDLTNGSYFVNEVTGVTGSVYTQVVKDFTVPEGCEFIRIELYNHVSGGYSGYRYYDDVFLTKIYTPPLPVSGARLGTLDDLFETTDETGAYIGDGGTGTNDSFLRISDQAAILNNISQNKILVANAESATVPGTVTKKIQVFDENGSSLGYVPVYDAII